MPAKHCRACQKDHPGCLCNTCKRDSLYQASACCQKRIDGKRARVPGMCVVGRCDRYEPEEER